MSMATTDGRREGALAVSRSRRAANDVRAHDPSPPRRIAAAPSGSFMIPAPVARDLVLVGGGHAHVLVLKRFGMRPMAGVRLTLVARDVETPYSGMLPGFIAGHYGFEECHIDLRRLARFANARLLHAEAIGIDRAARRVLFADRPPVPYDLLSLDIGSTPRMEDCPGAAEHAIPVKPIDRFAGRWSALMERVLRSEAPRRIAVVGGGAGGVELVLAAHHRLHALLRQAGRDPARLGFVLVTKEALLPSHNEGARRRLAAALAARGIELHAHREVTAVSAEGLTLAGGETVPATEVLWVTQAGAAPWLAETGLALDAGGFVKVRPTLQSQNDDAVFAAGDVAHVIGHERPKAGVFAVRQGPPLEANLRRVLVGRAPRPFVPQRRFLSLIGTGDRRAVASRGNWAAQGRALWWLKEWIDRRWMRKYRDLPEMAAPAPRLEVAAGDGATRALAAAAAMRCGGCGAKVGAPVLDRMLARLRPTLRQGDGILIGLDAPDDSAAIAVPPGAALVQSVDFFRAFVPDPFLFGRIVANHCLGDLHAMGARPHSALAIVTVPYGPEEKVEDDLYQMIAGALRTLDEAGASLIGGHSGEGAELALGFAVNGIAPAEALLRKSGLQPGDRLVLTKKLGTGVLFAAAMRNRARAPWIEAALAGMLQSSAAAAACLRQHGATACTDVTGFGLIGHLAEMLRPGGTVVRLDIDAVPALDGAPGLLAAGIASSLQAQNLHQRHIVENLAEHAGHPLLPLLFDPQTAGGLLAGVPAVAAQACLAALRAAGYEAAIIGTVLATGQPQPAIRLNDGHRI